MLWISEQASPFGNEYEWLRFFRLLPKTFHCVGIISTVRVIEQGFRVVEFRAEEVNSKDLHFQAVQSSGISQSGKRIFFTYEIDNSSSCKHCDRDNREGTY